jgi:polyferredoxin
MMNLVKIRIAISLAVFTLFLLLFLGGEKLSVFLSSTLLPFQFVPALIRVLTDAATMYVFGFVFIILITMIFGRVYCSFLCPLGALQDIFIALSRKFGWGNKHSYQKSSNWLRYSILGLVIVTAALGSMSLLNLLDPYSLSGRMITQFALPFFVWLYNAAVTFLKNFNIYLFLKETAWVPLYAFMTTLVFFLLILIMSVRHGRLYCNTLCPVGTLLGLISHVSIFKFIIDQTRCHDCIRCEGVCKAGCIDSQTATIDQRRCVNCFNCLAACPQSIVSYRPFWRKADSDAWSPARRGFLIGSVAAAGSGLIMFNSGIRNLLGNVHTSPNPPITPPGSVSVEHFTKSCSACHLCVSACPTKVITPSFLEYGIDGLLQPRLNYSNSFCDYECNICGRICPTGAILSLPLAEKKFTQIGTVDLLKDKCVVYVDKNNCGACGEVCPTHTISFIDKNNILYPEVDTKYCIGCGACQKACPTTPKSIVVRPNPVHQKAAKYLAKNSTVWQKKLPRKDFPF